MRSPPAHALCLALFAAPAAAQQRIDSLCLTVTTIPAVSTDDLFRGISQTRGRPAVQLGLDLPHGSGAYPGFRAAPGQFGLDDAEVMIKAMREIDRHKLLATAAFSTDFFGRSGRVYYLEGGADVALPFELTPGGLPGHQSIERNIRFGAPDDLWWSVGLSRPLPGGFTAAIAWYDKDIRRASCGGGRKTCGGRFMLTLTRPF
jgi:hypothetical protein